MAESEAEICSNALTLLGAETIASLSEDSERARLCARHYPKCRDEILRRARWKCAEKRQSLAQATAPPLFNWSFMFALPSDYIRIWATSLDVDEGGDGDPWSIEGKFLVANVTPVMAVYTQKITDVLLFDALLEKAITYDLAAKLCFPIAERADMQQTFEGMASRAILAGIAATGQEQTKKRYRSTMLTKDVR